MRVVRALLAMCVFGLMGCSASSKWDPQGAESLKQLATKVLTDLDAGNFQAMFAGADSNVVVLDFDENNAPFRVDGLVAANAFMAHMAEVAQSQGLKFTSTPVRSDAWATATMGYCIVEYDQSVTVGGQTMGPFKFRGTLVARRDGDRWSTTHWHGSFRETPPPMPPPVATKK